MNSPESQPQSQPGGKLPDSLDGYAQDWQDVLGSESVVFTEDYNKQTKPDVCEDELSLEERQFAALERARAGVSSSLGPEGDDDDELENGWPILYPPEQTEPQREKVQLGTKIRGHWKRGRLAVAKGTTTLKTKLAPPEEIFDIDSFQSSVNPTSRHHGTSYPSSELSRQYLARISPMANIEKEPTDSTNKVNQMLAELQSADPSLVDNEELRALTFRIKTFQEAMRHKEANAFSEKTKLSSDPTKLSDEIKYFRSEIARVKEVYASLFRPNVDVGKLTGHKLEEWTKVKHFNEQITHRMRRLCALSGQRYYTNEELSEVVELRSELDGLLSRSNAENDDNEKQEMTRDLLRYYPQYFEREWLTVTHNQIAGRVRDKVSKKMSKSPSLSTPGKFAHRQAKEAKLVDHEIAKALNEILANDDSVDDTNREALRLALANIFRDNIIR